MIKFIVCLALAWNLSILVSSSPVSVTSLERLNSLREQMKHFQYDAYIIPSEDEHQSEYVSKRDMRRQWISGFTGSAGVAVVTMQKAALWTDSRYYLRAEKELDDSNWLLMKSGLKDVPSVEEWLIEQLTQNTTSGEKIVGLNSKLVSITQWKRYESVFKKQEIKVKSPNTDLIDNIWIDRPTKPNDSIQIHKLEYAGIKWQDKINNVIEALRVVDADMFVVTALDETAWLFNLRGRNDIPYNPVFFSYAIVYKNSSSVFYIDLERVNDDLRNHLQNVTIKSYQSIFEDVEINSKENLTIWISPSSSYAIYDSVSNKDSLINNKQSPVKLLKSVKNLIERRRARECQIRDSAARVRHMYWLENQLKNGHQVTEISSATELQRIQNQDALFRGLSFGSISAVGAHASDIHYDPNELENKPLTKTEMYLLDAGAQYEDCTTDITRTHHYGKPTDIEKLAYTKVLQGSINLADLTFPASSTGRTIDVVARAPLWSAGLDYGHGTGHGIGYFLSVHEDPPYGSRTFDEPYAVGMFQSDEPGYYEDKKFGIRLETDLEVVKADTPYSFRNTLYLRFEAQSLLPFETNLIDFALLTKSQIDWLNKYNKRIRREVGNQLRALNQLEAYEYLLHKTEPIHYANDSSNAFKNSSNFMIILVLLVIFLF